jgi:hypothetical protein
MSEPESKVSDELGAAEEPTPPLWDLVETQACLARLWTMAKEWHGIRVRYNDVLAVAAWVPPERPWGTAEILLPRNPLPHPVDAPDLESNALGDLARLAHEFGRHLRYREDPTRHLPTNDLGEEERAWEYGRQVLRAIGFSSWPGFDELRDEHLRGLRRHHPA